jgi:hypothetical protein
VRLPDRTGRRSCLLGAVLAATCYVACGGGRESGPERSVASSTPENASESVRYVGEEACRPCHLGVHATFESTGMARSYAPAPTSALDSAMPASDRPMLSIGSGNHASELVAERDGRTVSLERCRFEGSDDWVPCLTHAPGIRHLSTGAVADCLFCHSAIAPKPRGVDCERCHGPGELHVSRWKDSSETGRGLADPTIVNPRRLTPERRMAVCLQCHLGDTGFTARVLRIGASPASFRPGRPLTDVWIPFLRVPASPSRFGAASQGDRLMLSRCFRESGGALDCLTCHNPHVSVYHEDRPADLFRRPCLRCHDSTACTAPPRSRRATVPEDDCVACHMRKAQPTDLGPTRYTDHWIRRRIDENEPEPVPAPVVEPLWPEALDGVSAGERSYYRARAYAMLAARSQEAERRDLGNLALDEIDRAVQQGFDAPELEALRVSLSRD